MKKNLYRSILKKERGQAIILVAFGIIGLVAMVGLVIDTGILFIEYGKLKRGVDAAAIAAAQQYRTVSGSTGMDQNALENAVKNFLQLNQSDILDENIAVYTCETADASLRPVLCNPDPTGNPVENRKLVRVIASKYVGFSFMRVIGINGTTISTESVGEAAAMDLVLVVDTSASMAYETSGNLFTTDPGDDPSVCNYSTVTPCQPMAAVKEVALDFIDTMYFPYDRVSIITMTSQTPGGSRNPEEVLPMTSDKATIENAIRGLKVFEPRVCAFPFETDTELGSCLKYNAATGGTFEGSYCPIFQNHSAEPTRDPSSCNSSNVGGTLFLAADALSDPVGSRPEAFWVVVALMGGPANVTDVPDPAGDFTNGFCPKYTWVTLPWCRDRRPSIRHDDSETMEYTNPENGVTETISIYDADDYARDRADQLATLVSETGVTIYTIGLGAQIQSTSTVDVGEPAAGEALLQYIAETAGGVDVNHGRYFFAPTGGALANIFELIANNIATRISQ